MTSPESPQRPSRDPADESCAPADDTAAPRESTTSLRASEEQFRRAIEDAPIPMIMHAEDGEVLQISRSWTELTGYTLADVPTLDAWLNHAYGHGADAVRSHVRDLFADDQHTLDVAFDIRTRTGELRHWSFSASSPGSLRDGRRFVIGMAQDITERVRTERALAEQARLLDLSNDAIIVRDVNNRIIYWNRGATEVYGWTRDEAVGQDLHTLLQTEFEAPFPELIARLHEHDRMEGEVVQVTRDGRRITLLCRWALDRDAEGRPASILTTYNDISARKRMEQALRESERDFRAIFEGSSVGKAQADPVTRHLLRVNAALCALTGYSEAELLALTVDDLTHPDDRERDRELFERLGRGIDSYQLEKRYLRKDGSAVWVTVTSNAIRDAAGQVVRTVSVIQDVTERKRAEAALRESEARFRTVTDAVPQLIWTNDADGKASYFNQRWHTYSGLSEEQSVGPGWQAIVHPDDAPASIERWQQALAKSDTFETEYRLRRADGAYRWQLGRNVPLRDEAGRLIGWFGSATDIEELKQAEAARRESEERFRLLVEGARDYAMFLLDPENRITFWSTGSERVFGWSEKEALGQDGAIVFTEEDRAAGVPAQERATAQRERSAVDRRWHIRKDGSLLFVDGALIRLDDEQGGLRGFVKIGRDATVQREAEEAVERANAELEQRVQERTAALTASNQARQELMGQLLTAQEEERLRIARDLHDQLGQLITGLLLGLKQLEQRAEGSPLAPMLPPLQDLAMELAKDAHRLATNLRPTALDDVGLVSALELLVREWSSQSRVKAAFHSQGLAGGRLPLDMETTLYRVVQEALTNVRKHAEAQNVSVLLERRGDEVLVIVEDDGRGFDPDAIPARAERPSLGLRGMRERVEQVGGSLEIETSPGSGTTLFIRIPLDLPALDDSKDLHER